MLQEMPEVYVGYQKGKSGNKVLSRGFYMVSSWRKKRQVVPSTPVITELVRVNQTA